MKNGKMNKWKETLRRSTRTFVQTFAGYIVINLPAICNNGVIDTETQSMAIKGLLIGAIASGLSALMNLPTEKESD